MQTRSAHRAHQQQPKNENHRVVNILSARADRVVGIARDEEKQACRHGSGRTLSIVFLQLTRRMREQDMETARKI